ncbi:MAG: hypothetical protein ACTHMI_06685 [Mucilaginibacter sp.]|uniref:hypothetical protein n=1 Tax=Mucilaginibacter sp. L3T2-6 TaxID=3062491 RepID=UPI0026756FAF|nr:hypothetical protein [Mucilaginibacter sp. L3T2-6]MDO3640551.1 hypothetical protein [Mucilaginibacter sp. L3T2-6]MDV6213110.1 hypothetical protein [Mucilaginibacter sp. L3T2-6]
MRTFYLKLFFAFSIACTIASCKLDAPVYPSGAQSGSNGNTQPGNDGNGLPIGAASNIQVKIGNITYIFNNAATYNVLPVGTPGFANGQTTLAAEGQTAEDKGILVFPSATTGTFDLSDMEAGNFKIDLTAQAKIKVTALSETNTQGTFSCDMVDKSSNKVYTHCLGSFNINK